MRTNGELNVEKEKQLTNIRRKLAKELIGSHRSAFSLLLHGWMVRKTRRGREKGSGCRRGRSNTASGGFQDWLCLFDRRVSGTTLECTANHLRWESCTDMDQHRRFLANHGGKTEGMSRRQSQGKKERAGVERGEP